MSERERAMSERRPLLVVAMRAELPASRRAGALVVGTASSWAAPPRLTGEGPVLVTGTCGALVSGVARSRLVLPDRLVDERGIERLPDPDLRQRLLLAARALGFEVETGGLASVPSVVDLPEARRALADVTGCRFADLESSALAGLAAAGGRPWAVLRFVSDVPERPLGWLFRLYGGTPAVEPTALGTLVDLARRPWLLPRLVGLGLAVARGRERVGRTLSAAFPPTGEPASA